MSNLLRIVEYKPRLELLRKILPLTSPTSTLMVWPEIIARAVRSRSFGIFKSLAK